MLAGFRTPPVLSSSQESTRTSTQTSDPATAVELNTRPERTCQVSQTFESTHALRIAAPGSVGSAPVTTPRPANTAPAPARTVVHRTRTSHASLVGSGNDTFPDRIPSEGQTVA